MFSGGVNVVIVVDVVVMDTSTLDPIVAIFIVLIGRKCLEEGLQAHDGMDGSGEIIRLTEKSIVQE